MTLEKNSSKDKDAEKPTIDVELILKTQFNHWLTKDTFWYCFTWLEVYLIMSFLPGHAKDVWPKIMGCLTPDVQNGEIQAYKIQYVSKEESKTCAWLPEGYKLTQTQFFTFYVCTMGTTMILSLNVLYWFIYRGEYAFFEQYKVEKDTPWPWKTDKEAWRRLIIKATKCCIFNNVIMNFLCLTFTAYVYNWQIPWRFDVASLPDAWEMARHFAILIICEDFGFHCTHRALHCKHPYMPLYQWIHKQHHEFMHPVSIASENAHPLEFAFGNHYTSMIGMFILGPKLHFFTIVQWGLIRVLETHDGHSGYEFPWSVFRLIPFGADGTYHIYHHTKNVGNYSSFMTIWDTVFNSNVDFYEQYPLNSRDVAKVQVQDESVKS